MKKYAIFSILLLIMIPVFLQAQQENQDVVEQIPIFIRATIYPTASLSRYDYNNDIDRYELRAYVELRTGDQLGEPIKDAQVFVQSEKLELMNGHYEKRIKVSKEELVYEFQLQIKTRQGIELNKKYPIPAWIILQTPKPQILEPDKELPITWKYSRFCGPVNIHVYNFKSGEQIWNQNDLDVFETTIPADKLPASTIVRIYIIQSWLFKKYLRGDKFVRGSEINVIPWSQVFIRAR